MKFLMISHEVCMLIAEVFILWAVIVARRKGTSHWLKTHRILTTLGLIFVLLSAIAIYSFKELHSYPHLASLHALIGGLAIGMLAANYIVGVGLIKQFIKNRIIHRTLGRITAFVIVTAAVAGVIRFVQILNAST